MIRTTPWHAVLGALAATVPLIASCIASPVVEAVPTPLATVEVRILDGPDAAPTYVQELVPVTRFDTPINALAVRGLTEVLVPSDLAEATRTLLPNVRVIADPDPVARVRATGEVALVPAALVNPSVKTLALDGQYFWDGSHDPVTYPLKISRAGAAPAAFRVWNLLAAGEMIFGRGVQERIERHHGGDAASAFTEVRDLVRGADLAVATLEAPLSGNANRWCDTCMRFIGNERYAQAIADAGFDAVSLAANHIGDAGPEGVLNTIRILEANGIRHAGAGPDYESARQPAVLVLGDLRVALLGYNDVPPVSYAASAGHPGSAWLTHDDPAYSTLRAEIAQARGGADLVVILAHWGIEYEDAPQSQVVAAAHAMVDAGATVVIGDHPHWVQAVESYHGAFITYGIGNFVFDQMWSPETREGSIDEFFFAGPRLVAVRIRPTIIDDYYKPRLLRPEEQAYTDTLQRIWRHSIFR